MSSRTGRRNWPVLYIAVGLTTLATMLLELSLTRIFSVVFSYHFAFLAISIALFGLGAGGALSCVLAGRAGAGKLGGLALIASALAAVALATVLSEIGPASYAALTVVYFTSALPFVAAGAILATVMAEAIERVGRVYFADLLGAAAACVILVPLLDGFGGPNTVLAAAAAYAAAGAVWFAEAGLRRERLAATSFAVLLAAAILLNARAPFLDVDFAKGRPLAGELFVDWNSTARVSVAAAPGDGLRLIVDAEDAGRLPSVDLDHLTPETRAALLHHGPGLPYQLRPGAKTLILRAGPGWEVARALASGSRDVTAVEPNAAVAGAVMRDRFAEYTRGLYLRPGVRIAVEDARSFVRRSRETYAVIQANLVESSPPPAGGAFALSESSLYTTDAFSNYLARLAPDGLMAFTARAGNPPRESLRIAAIARAALERSGRREVWRHVAVAREATNGGPSDTVLVGAAPLALSDIALLRREAAHDRLEVLYAPGDEGAGIFGALLRSPDPRTIQNSLGFDIRPVDDNRPFFFYTARPADLIGYLRGSAVNGGVSVAGLMFTLLAVSAVATVVLLVLPGFTAAGSETRGRSASGLGYFAFLGAGYILVQVALVQKSVLFLGNAAHAVTIVIFAVLISSGIGSYFSDRLAFRAGLRPVLVVLTASVAALGLVIGPAISAAGAWPSAARIALAAALTAPVGFLMGVPFPAGLRRIGRDRPAAVRWAWSVNAAASVLGSVAAVAIGVHFGLREALLAGAAMYGLAAIRTPNGGVEDEEEARADATVGAVTR